MKTRAKVHSGEITSAPYLPPDLKDSDPWYDIISIHGPISAVQAIGIGRQLEKQAASLYEYALKKNPRLKRPAPPQKIPKSYFLLCMSHYAQIEARKNAKELGVALSVWIAGAIHQMSRSLEAEVKLKRMTGTARFEATRLFGWASGKN